MTHVGRHESSMTNDVKTLTLLYRVIFLMPRLAWMMTHKLRKISTPSAKRFGMNSREKLCGLASLLYGEREYIYIYIYIYIYRLQKA